MTKLHIENINITFSSAKPSMPPIGLLAALAGIGDSKPCKRPTELPAIGDKWPGTEAIYAGKAPSRDGSKIVDLIYWPDESQKERNFEENKAWCEAVDTNTGSHAATRQQAIVLNDNLRQLMSTGDGYWTETKDNADKYAFVQYFSYGSQYITYLAGKFRALAVSEIR